MTANWSEPTVLPTDEQVDIAANPLRRYLLALAADLTASMASLNADPTPYTQGEVEATTRAMAHMLVHQYGLRYLEAYDRVEKAAEQQVGNRSTLDPGWEHTKHSVYEMVVTNLMDPEWVVPE